MSKSSSRGWIASATLFALASMPLVAAPAFASPDGTGVVIDEIYTAGGNSGAALNADFVELANPGDQAVDLSGWSLQYRSATGGAASGGNLMALSGTVPAGGRFLITGPAGASGAALPKGDLATSLAAGADNGQILLVRTATAVAPGAETAESGVVDFVGYGAANRYEGAAAASSPTKTQSLSRTASADTDDNSVDFARSAPSPEPSGAEPGTGEPGTGEPGTGEPGSVTPIAEIQGTGASTPLAGKRVTTRGIVTAAYPSGGFNGFYIQTPGTGGQPIADRAASDAVFVYSADTVGSVSMGDHVEVTGTAAEFNGLTQLSVPAGGTKRLAEPAAAVQPVQAAFPKTDAERERLEGMLIAPQGEYTVADVYETNQYAEVPLVASGTPIVTPTALGAPGSPEYEAAKARPAAEVVVLDDGSTADFFNAAKNTPLPYLTGNIVRTGAGVEFTRPVVLDFRNKSWKFQPTGQLTVANAADVQPVRFEDTRTDAPDISGGDVRLATFNVLNYFSTTGADVSGCVYYTDRAGAPVAVKEGCSVRGAANAENLARQQDKIVTAINGLGADVVSLAEIENSKQTGHADRDLALKTLVAALNAQAGAGTWAYAASPEKLPAREDVIRTAFIYKSGAIETVGGGKIFDSPNFANARQPYAQGFKPKGGSDDDVFVVVTNHLKSKGGTGTGDNADTGDGAGSWNGDRTRQAADAVRFASDMRAELGTEKAYIVGDLNSYAFETPVRTFIDAGYVDQGAKTGKYTYGFKRALGSLDYILASPAADATVVDSDVWNINSAEPVAREYSRYNYNATNFYAADQFRSSDHDPVVVAIDTEAGTGDGVKRLNLIDINDFHGRIDANTLKFAGTVESLRAEFPKSSVMLSTGDNIGASLFASAVAKDQPTIELLNALGLEASALGNHEFDQGFDDITGRVAEAADFDYLGANVTRDGKPVFDEYRLVESDGVTVGVIGAVTQETPALVAPGGIEGLEFGDPVEAVNRVAERLTDGNTENGEADVIVAAYHEGAPGGGADPADLAKQLEQSAVFKRIVNGTSPKVDAIFNGHTHATYAWNAAVPGQDGRTRPVVQTGSYGDNIGQVVLDYDVATGETEASVVRNVARLKTEDADLLAQYPALAEVKRIVDAALENAKTVGNEVVARTSGEITTAYAAGKRDDRASESTLGNLVADSLLDTLAPAERGGAEIGVINPGGLRADLDAGDITYAEANAVLPFVNNLWTTTLTGAQFKKVLEQQWQRDAQGQVPSRAYLQLGLSKNVGYTADESRPEGDRITGITVNGKPIDPQREYRIGSVAFLVQGGDNFREFASGKNPKDTGLVDRDAWIEYLRAKTPVAPDYARRGIHVSGLPETPVAAGSKFELRFSKLDLTSLGVPKNTEVTVELPGASPVVARVTDGAAVAQVTVPARASGRLSLGARAKESGASAVLPIEVVAAPTPKDPFRDVTKTSKFYREIGWMHEIGLATGVKKTDAAGNTVFDYEPANPVTRGAMAAFLFRLEAPKGYRPPKTSPFADVRPGDKFYKEIAWMYEAKLSAGVAQKSGKPKYLPASPITRGAMAAFMYRKEAPKGYLPPKTSPFADVRPGDKFYKEIAWMREVGLTAGIAQPSGKPKYLPASNVTRGAMAAFLYRAEH